MGSTLRPTLWRVIVWRDPVSIESDPDRATLLGLVLRAVEVGRVGMGNNDIMAADPWLGIVFVATGSQ